MIASAIALAKIYEDDVKRFAIDKINENLIAKVDVESIDFTLIERFPNATLKFKNVLLKDSINQNDTIIFAENLYLKLNIWDIINEIYDVNELEAKNATINLKVDKKGNENYLFWKKSQTNDSTKKSLSFNLNNVDISNAKLSYVNQLTNQDYFIKVNTLGLAGDFTSKSYNVTTKGDLFCQKFISKGTDYLPNQPVILDLDLSVNTTEKTYRINDCDLLIADLKFKTGGYYNSEISLLDLVVIGNEIDVISLFSVLPNVYKSSIENYASKGVLNFEASINGKTSKQETPVVKANFTLKNSTLTEQKNDIELHKINLQGSYTSKNTQNKSELNLNSFSGSFEDGTFSGSLNLVDFDKPKLTISSKGNLNLETIYRFLSSTNLEKLSGKIQFDGKFTGLMVDENLKIQQSEGLVDFSNVSFSFKNQVTQFKNMKGVFELKRNHAYVTNLTGNINETIFELDGYFRNFLPYILLSNQTLTIESKLNVGEADIKQLMTEFSSESGEKQESRINLNLSLSADKLTYNKLIAEEVQCKVQLHDNQINYQNLKFKNSEGSVLSNGDLYPLKNGTYLLELDALATHVNSSEFFRQLDNFGQDYLTDKNLKGWVDNSIKLTMELTKSFEIIPKTVKAQSAFNISNGELINVSSLTEMAQYIADDWKIRPFIDEDLLIKKIKHVKFKTLELNVIVKDEIIYIPYTEIKSDLMNINGEGIHKFNDEVDYKFNFRLRDALIKEDKNKESEFGGYHVDDGTGMRIFIRMTGNIEDPEMSIDASSKKDYRQEELQHQKQDVKSILKDEFGLFKKDSTISNKIDQPEEKVKFVVDWEEFDEETSKDSTSSKGVTTETPKKKNERMQKFLKKIGAEENKEEDVEFKIDQ